MKMGKSKQGSQWSEGAAWKGGENGGLCAAGTLWPTAASLLQTAFSYSGVGEGLLGIFSMVWFHSTSQVLLEPADPARLINSVKKAAKHIDICLS